MEKPHEYRNFEVKEGLLYLKEHGHPVLCIPKVMIQERSRGHNFGGTLVTSTPWNAEDT